MAPAVGIENGRNVGIRQECKMRRSWDSVCLPFVSREYSREKEILTWSGVVPHGWI